MADSYSLEHRSRVNTIHVSVDFREHYPWRFKSSNVEVITHLTKLECGDYQLANSQAIVIEKKANVSELRWNFSDKIISGTLYRPIDHFLKECKSMCGFDRRYIICSFTKAQLEKDLLVGCSAQDSVTCSRILSTLEDIKKEYRISTIFSRSDREAELYALNELKLAGARMMPTTDSF